MDKITELAKKLNELAKQGIGGEKENAKIMLDKLIKKHGLSMDSIEDPKTEDFIVKISKDQLKLMCQIIICVLGAKCEIWKVKGKRTSISINCTNIQFIEIQSMFEFYWTSYQNELKTFYTAFLHKNRLFPSDGEVSNELSNEESKRIRDMMDGIKKQQYLKQLES